MTSPALEPALFYQSAHGNSLPTVKKAEGHYFVLENGQVLLDATGGAAVSAIGHGNERVKNAIKNQLDCVTYAHPGYFTNRPSLDLAQHLVDSTNGKMARAMLYGSGSEAMEAAMKLAFQYWSEYAPEQNRYRFIARTQSWHGCTLGTLALGDFKGRKAPFLPLLADNVSRVSNCHPYRHKNADETNEMYIARLAQELDDEFQRLGPETVCAFVVEPFVGTAIGCATALPGYFPAMKAVCDKYDALLIFDEVMCGLGRSGTMHAWEQEGVVPDIQAIGKGLGAGYGTLSGVMVHQRVVDGFKAGSGFFQHGQTFQCHPLTCIAALEVQRIIKEENLVANAHKQGQLLGQLLHEKFDNHPHVGEIRGRGLFWCMEFVKDRATKEPFDVRLGVARRLRMKGLEPGYDVCLFSSNGCVDGDSGDHFLMAPPLTFSEVEIRELVERAGRVVDSVTEDLAALAHIELTGKAIYHAS